MEKYTMAIETHDEKRDYRAFLYPWYSALLGHTPPGKKVR